MEETPAIAEVRQVFQRFHEGYVKRDLNGLDAVLVKEEGRWLFRQMQFSFATLRSPDERVV